MRKNDSGAFNAGALLVYSVLITVSAAFHEPWRDEAQAWLIARDLPLPGILHQMGYEGSPALWHLLLIPFAKLGAPFASLEALHVLIAILMIGVFLFFSPFPRWTRVLVAFSYYMTFEYAVIARNYSMGILLLFLIAVLYDKRFARPLLYASLVFLLFNTNVHSFGFAGGLLVLYLFEAFRKGLDRRTCYALGVMGLGALLCILQVMPRPNQLIRPSTIYFNPLIIPVAVKHVFFHTLESSVAVSFLMGIGSTVILSVVLFHLIKKPPALFLFLVSYFWLFFIFVFKHIGNMRHHGLLFVSVIFCLWIAEFYEESTTRYPSLARRFLRFDWKRISLVLINLSLLFSAYLSGLFLCREITMDYSGSKRMARYIQENRLEDRPIAAHTILTETLLALLPSVRFWYPSIGDWGTFATWDYETVHGNTLTPEEVVRKVGEQGFPRDRILLLLTSPLANPEADHYRLLFKVDDNIFGLSRNPSKEAFYLYEPAPEKLSGGTGNECLSPKSR